MPSFQTVVAASSYTEAFYWAAFGSEHVLQV